MSFLALLGLLALPLAAEHPVVPAELAGALEETAAALRGFAVSQEPAQDSAALEARVAALVLERAKAISAEAGFQAWPYFAALPDGITLSFKPPTEAGSRDGITDMVDLALNAPVIWRDGAHRAVKVELVLDAQALHQGRERVRAATDPASRLAWLFAPQAVAQLEIARVREQLKRQRQDAAVTNEQKNELWLPNYLRVPALDDIGRLFELRARRHVLGSEAFAAVSGWELDEQERERRAGIEEELLSIRLEAGRLAGWNRWIRPKGGALFWPHIASKDEEIEAELAALIRRLEPDVADAAAGTGRQDMAFERAVAYLRGPGAVAALYEACREEAVALRRQLAAPPAGDAEKRISVHDRVVAARAAAANLDAEGFLEELREAETLARQLGSTTSGAAERLRGPLLERIEYKLGTARAASARLAVAALPRMGPAAYPALLAAVRTRSSASREAAVTALRQMPELPEALAKPLSELAADESASGDARLAAARALVKRDPKPQLLELLADALSSGTQITYETALMTLRDLGPAAVPAWLRAAQGSDPWARKHAVRNLKGAAASDGKARAAIEKALSDTDPDVRRAAAETLEALKR